MIDDFQQLDPSLDDLPVEYLTSLGQEFTFSLQCGLDYLFL